MPAGFDNVLEEDVYNGEMGHAAKHNQVNDQVNFLTEELLALRDTVAIAPEAIGDPNVDRDNLQAALDSAAAAGGGVVRIPIGHYSLTLATGERYCLTVPANVRVEGSGWGTHIELDPVVALAPGGIYHVIEIGSDTTAASNTGVARCRVTGNQSTEGTPVGAYIQGIAARHDSAGAGVLQHSDNVVVEGNWILDTNIGVVCSKDTTASASDADRIAAQYDNWIVRGNYIDTCTNKAVELQEASDSSIEGNRMVNVFDGPQAILFSRRIKIVRNHIEYHWSGPNATEGVEDITIEGNTIVCAAVGGYAGIQVRREPYANATTVKRVRIVGNTVIDEVSTNRRAFVFESRTENTGGVFQDVTIEGNVFVGKVYLYDRTFPAKTTGSGLVVSGNDFHSDVFTASGWVSPGTLVRHNRFRTAHIANTSDWAYRSNTLDATLTVVGARITVDNAPAIRTRGGGYYLPPGSADVQTGSITVDRIIYVPLVLDVATPIDKLGVEITTSAGAGALARLGVYKDDGGKPGSLLAEAASTIDMTQAPGFYQVDCVTTLPAGLVWLAYKTEGTTSTVRCHLGRLKPVQHNAGAGFAANLYNGYLQTGVTAGALAASAGGVLSVVANAPVILARAV